MTNNAPVYLGSRPQSSQCNLVNVIREYVRQVRAHVAHVCWYLYYCINRALQHRMFALGVACLKFNSTSSHWPILSSHKGPTRAEAVSPPPLAKAAALQNPQRKDHSHTRPPPLLLLQLPAQLRWCLSFRVSAALCVSASAEAGHAVRCRLGGLLPTIPYA
jgi:hypothetical protein